MTRRKKYSGETEVYDPKTKKLTKVEYVPAQVAAKRRYYQNQQPPEPERWTHVQFQKWVEDMDYPRKTVMDSRMWFPFEPKPIARDLGIKTNRVYAYWRGADKGATVTVPPTTTLLCKAGLILKQLGKWPL